MTIGIKIASLSILPMKGNYVKESGIKYEKIQFYVSKNDNTIDGNIFDAEIYSQILKTVKDNDSNKNLKSYISEIFFMLFD